MNMTGALFLCLTFLFGVLVCHGACPKGFEDYNSKCYLFSHGENTWTAALDSCKMFDATLIEIEDVAENEYIKTKSAALGGHYWIGLEDKQIEGEFMWATSEQSLTPGQFSDWGQGEPNSSHDNENCVLLTPNANYTWADASCTRTERYICEMREDQKYGGILKTKGSCTSLHETMK